jgi:hypothetical protein
LQAARYCGQRNASKRLCSLWPRRPRMRQKTSAWRLTCYPGRYCRFARNMFTCTCMECERLRRAQAPSAIVDRGGEGHF